MKSAQERLKFILNYTGMTPKPLADHLNIKPSILQNINKGVQKNFPYFVAKKLETEFNFSIDWSMDGEGEIFIKPTNTLERRALSIDELLSRTDSIGKIVEHVRTFNNLSIEEFINILKMSKERYLEICIENKLPTISEVILLTANFDIKIDDLLFDFNNDIKKLINEQAALNAQLTNLSPLKKAILKKSLK